MIKIIHSLEPRLQPQADWRDAQRRDDAMLIRIRQNLERIKQLRLIAEAQLVARSNR